MNLVPKSDRPSILVDTDSGLEITDFADRDVKHPYESWGCLWGGRFLLIINAKYLGYTEQSGVPQVNYSLSLPALRRAYSLGVRKYAGEERERLGSFENLLPIMLEAWRIQKGSPKLFDAGGRVAISLVDADQV